MNNKKQSAFTLLELLVALAIFAIISVGAFQLITQVTNYQQRSEQRMQAFNAVSAVLNIMERELLQAIDRPIRDEFGDALPALVGDSQSVELTSGARISSPVALRADHGAQADLQRSLYRLKLKYQEGTYISIWTRQQWDVLDRVQQSQPVQTLAIPLDQVNLRYLSHSRHWLTEWPDSSGHAKEQQPLPLAIELQLVTGQFGTITRLFEVSQ